MSKRTAKSYRRHTMSKRARIEHTRRVKQRKTKYGGLAAFSYDCAIGRSLRQTGGGKLK